MKRALSLIAATVVTASVYSQPYTGSSAARDALMEQARQRIYETPLSGSGAAGASQAESASGFERSATGASNSSTGQSNGSNVSGGSSASSTDGSAVTKDSDISGLENPKTSGGREGSVQSGSIERADSQKQGAVGGAPTKTYNGTDYWQQPKGVGAPAGSQSGAVSSDDKDMKKDCDADKGKAHKTQTSSDWKKSDGSAVRSSGTAVESDERYRINREQGSVEGQYHVNREAGAPASAEASGSAATSESGARSSGSAVDSDERARRERESRGSSESEKSGTTPSSGTATDSDQKAHPDL